MSKSDRNEETLRPATTTTQPWATTALIFQSSQHTDWYINPLSKSL